MITRRIFVSLVMCGLLLRPDDLRAQRAGKVYRIGWLREGVLPIAKPFWDAMRDFGWVEARNVVVEARYAENPNQLPALAAELAQMQVDVIMTNGTPAAKAAKEATATIPIVFTLAGDPVERGLVASMAKPGGNMTGFALGLYGEKQVQIIKEALPGASRIAVPNSDESPGIVRVAKGLGVQVQDFVLRGPEDFEPFCIAAKTAKADAAVIPNIAWYGPHLERIAALVVQYRLPAIGYRRIFAESGGLLSYGPTLFQDAPRVAAQVDKILKGAKPADLPVEQPTTFELVINMRTAKSLGLTIPQALLLRVTEKIG